MLLLKPVLFCFVFCKSWLEMTIWYGPAHEHHSTSWDEMLSLTGDRGTPGLLWGLWQWCWMRSDCPRPSLHTSRGQFCPYQALGLSDMMSPLCPDKYLLKTGHLSSLCCTVGLALCVEHDWHHSAPFLTFACKTFVWDHVIGPHCGSHPHLFCCKESCCMHQQLSKKKSKWIEKYWKSWPWPLPCPTHVCRKVYL